MVEKIDTGFPNDTETNAQKKSKEFGKQIGEAISNEWYESGQLTERRRWIDLMRTYSRGEQDTQQYQDTIEGKKVDQDGNNVSYKKTHKIDYTVLKIMPTFKDILVNQIDESLFKPRAEAIDITAINKKRAYFKKLEQDYYTRRTSDIVNQGVGLQPDTNSPQNEDELNARKLEYKPKIEIAQELAIENVLKLEKFEALKDKVDEDLVDLGIGVMRHYTDYSEGIKLEYVDPYNWIHSQFEMDDGRDIRYEGIAKKGTLADLIKRAGGMSAADKLAIKNLALGKPDNDLPYVHEDDGARIVDYFVFSYLTGEERTFKKLRSEGSIKLIDRTEDGYEPKRKDKKISIPYNVWYEGIYVPMADVLVQWEKLPNQVESAVNKPVSPFVIYAPKVKRHTESGIVRFDSLVQRAIPIIDDIHRDYYKFQQLKMELRPTTVTINPQALNNVVMNGEKVSPEDILNLFFGRGVLLANEIDEEGDPIGKAITENAGGINNTALGFLSNELANGLNRIRQLIGVNEVRDGSAKPNSKTPVTVQKILLASSNNSTNHIVKASFNISLRISEGISLRLYDVLTTPALKNRYFDAIGSDNVELLEELKKFPMTKFAIYFDFKPDSEERIAFEQSLLNSYQQGQIDVAQYNKARMVRNAKSAIKYLEIVIEKNRAVAEANKITNIQKQAEANARTSVITEQTKQQTLTIKLDVSKQEKLFQAQLDSEAEKQKAMLNELSAQANHNRDMELKRLEVFGQVQKTKLTEEGKDDRENLRATNQSKLIDQRKNNTQPIDFNNQIEDIFNDKSLLTNQN